MSNSRGADRQREKVELSESTEDNRVQGRILVAQATLTFLRSIELMQ